MKSLNDCKNNWQLTEFIFIQSKNEIEQFGVVQESNLRQRTILAFAEKQYEN